MEHICKRCGYTSNRLSNLKTHFQRKYPCIDNLQSGKSIQSLLEELSPDASTFSYKCIFCGVGFETRQGRYKHNKICQSNKDQIIETQNKEIKHLKEQLQASQSTTTHNNIVITYNTNISFVVNDFGNEDVSYIQSDKLFLDKCLKELSSGIGALVEKIYFDDDHPENKTIMMKNFKLNQVMVKEDGEWKQKHTKETIPKMVKKGQKILHNHIQSIDDVEPEEGVHYEIHQEKTMYINDLLIPHTIAHKDASSIVKSIIGNYNYNK